MSSCNALKMYINGQRGQALERYLFALIQSDTTKKFATLQEGSNKNTSLDAPCVFRYDIVLK